MPQKDSAAASAVRQSRFTLFLLVTACLLAVGGLGWFAVYRPDSRWLPPDPRAEWVVYPICPVAHLHRVPDFKAVFRRTFAAPASPAPAELHVSSFGACAVRLNGSAVALPEAPAGDCRRLRSCDVSSQLRAGDNDLTVVVTNNDGPPALWLAILSPDWSLRTDEQWQVTLAGAAERPARPAGAAVAIEPGNPVYAGEHPLESARTSLPLLLLFAGLSAAALAALSYWQIRRQRELPPWALWAVPAVLWVVLLTNNSGSLIFHLGFDCDGHLDYVRYLQTQHRLPLPNDGWEMHHPPLYYLVSAAALSLCGLTPDDPASVFVLRGLGLLAGLVQLALLYGCLCQVFPDRPTAQTVGLLLGALLPAQLYLFHYVGNEALAATLATAAVYCCLRLLRSDRDAAWPYALLGACLGAAVLTKVTALLVTAVVLTVLAGRLIARRQWNWRVWARTVGCSAVVCAAVGGWHYARIWAHFGTPLVGNYDRTSGFDWWQDPGYATPSYLVSFGEALTQPFFSSFYGLPDGTFSTLWGDGLWGGTAHRRHRPPWNYDLMAAGYLLALVPTVLVLVGLAAVLVQAVRRPRAEWLLLLGLPFGFGAAVLYQNLRYPYYGHVKAFYSLPALLSLCALAGAGCEVLVRRRRVASFIVATALGAWALTAYASFWVRPNAAGTQAWTGWWYLDKLHQDEPATVYLNEALKSAPQDADAGLGMAWVLGNHGAIDAAVQQLQYSLQAHPGDADLHLFLGEILLRLGRVPEAERHVRRAVDLAPQHSRAFSLLAMLLTREGRLPQAVNAYREALAITPTDPRLHTSLGLLLVQEKKEGEALEHYRFALGVQSNLPQTLDALAWLLATAEDPQYRDAAEAVRLADQACALTGSQEVSLLETLAAAYASAGRFDRAAEAETTASRLASVQGRKDLLPEMKRRLELYRGRQPYRKQVEGKASAGS